MQRLLLSTERFVSFILNKSKNLKSFIRESAEVLANTNLQELTLFIFEKEKIDFLTQMQ